MIHRCHSFMRPQVWIEIQCCEGLCNPIFGKGGSEIFEKLFTRLRKSDLEERFKLLIIQTAVFFNQKHGRSDVWRRHERFGFYLEAERSAAYAGSQYRECRKRFLSRFCSELVGNFLLNHDQYGPALFIFECF